jgi:hypothetical protein
MEKLHRHTPENLDYEIRRIYKLIDEYLKLDGSNANQTINLQGNNLVTTGSVGAGTITPRRKIDALDTTAAQIRATHTDNALYTDFQTNSNGYFSLMPTGKRVGVNVTAVESNLHIRGFNNATFLVELDVTGSGALGFQFKNSPAGTNHKFTDFSIGEYQVIQRFPNDNFTDAKNFFKVTKGGSDGYTPVYTDFEWGNVTIGGEYGTARLQLPAGTTAASSAPLKILSGPLMTTPESGAIEFLTDDLYATITTGAARKKFVLDDGTALTSGRIPYATTNGRLKDDAGLTFDGTNLSTTGNCASAGFKVGATAGIDATVPVAPVAPATVAGSMTFTKGILTAYTAPT